MFILKNYMPTKQKMDNVLQSLRPSQRPVPSTATSNQRKRVRQNGVASSEPIKQKRCTLCPAKKDQKTKFCCTKCIDQNIQFAFAQTVKTYTGIVTLHYGIIFNILPMLEVSCVKVYICTLIKSLITFELISILFCSAL